MKRIRAALVVGVLSLAACGSSGDDANDFVGDVNEHVQQAAKDVRLVLDKVIESDTTGDYVNVATNADTVHENLDQLRQEMLAAADADNDDQLSLIDAENEIKKGMGTITQWADDQSPSLTARWSREVGTGVAGWNRYVRKIWTKADVSPIPIIRLPDLDR